MLLAQWKESKRSRKRYHSQRSLWTEVFRNKIYHVYNVVQYAAWCALDWSVDWLWYRTSLHLVPLLPRNFGGPRGEASNVKGLHGGMPRCTFRALDYICSCTPFHFMSLIDFLKSASCVVQCGCDNGIHFEITYTAWALKTVFQYLAHRASLPPISRSRGPLLCRSMQYFSMALGCEWTVIRADSTINQ